MSELAQLTASVREANAVNSKLAQGVASLAQSVSGFTKSSESGRDRGKTKPVSREQPAADMFSGLPRGFSSLPKLGELVRGFAIGKFPGLAKKMASGMQVMSDALVEIPEAKMRSISALAQQADSFNKIAGIDPKNLKKVLTVLPSFSKRLINFSDAIAKSITVATTDRLKSLVSSINMFGEISSGGLAKNLLTLRLLGGGILKFAKTIDATRELPLAEIGVQLNKFGDIFNAFVDRIEDAATRLSDSKIGKTIRDVGLGILSLAASVGVAAVGFILFSKVTWAGVGKGLAAVSGLALISKFISDGDKGKGLLFLGAALTISAGGFILMSKVNWADIGKGLIAIGGIAAISRIVGKAGPSLIKGSLGIAALGVSLIPFALVLRMFSGIDYDAVTQGGIALGALIAIGAAAGAGIKLFALGALAIGLLSGSLLVFGAALNKLSTIDYSGATGIAGAIWNITKAVPAILLTIPAIPVMGLLGLALISLGLGLRALQGIQTAGFPAIGEGVKAIVSSIRLRDILKAPAILALGGAFISLGLGLRALQGIQTAGFPAIGEGVKAIVSSINLRDLLKAPAILALGGAFISLAAGVAAVRLAMIGDGEGAALRNFFDTISTLDGLQMSAAALGIGALGAALVAFGGGSAVSGFGDFIGKLFGGGKSPLDKLIEFSKEGAALKGIGDGFEKIVQGLKEIHNIGANVWSGLLNFDYDSISEKILRLTEESGALSQNLNSLSPIPSDSASRLIDSGGMNARSVVVVNNVSRGGDTSTMNSSSNSNTTLQAKRSGGVSIAAGALGFYNE